MTTPTRFASLQDFDKGGIEIVGTDAPPRYLFSNLFEVAGHSAPWERVVVAKNLEFTIECARAEGNSPWFLCAHDESLLAMQGEMEIDFVKPDDDALVPEAEGAVRLAGQPAGRRMGRVRLQRGHLALLPGGAAYRVRPQGIGVVLLQSVLGPESLERWASICQH